MHGTEEPLYDLGLAKRLVASDAFRLDPGGKCERALFEEVPTGRAFDFVQQVFALLCVEDFMSTVHINTAAIAGSYDQYALRLSDAVVDEFELRRRAWYVKFKVTELRGRSVFVLSLHPLHYAAVVRDGRLLRPD